MEKAESANIEEADGSGGTDTFTPAADVVASITTNTVDHTTAPDTELPLVTDRDRELMQYRLAPVEDAIDNLPDPEVVAQLLHDRGNLVPEDAEKAAWWVSKMAVAYRCCVSAAGKPPART